MKPEILKIARQMVDDGVPGVIDFVEINYDNDQATLEDLQDYIDGAKMMNEVQCT
jgi:hypothetical protein